MVAIGPQHSIGPPKAVGEFLGRQKRHLSNTAKFGDCNMGRTANDDRSDSMNPNNEAYDDSMDNHSNQLNPNNEAYQGTVEDDEDE